MKLKIFIKLIIIIAIMISIISCTNYLNSVDELDYLSKKQKLTLAEKDHLYPAWNINLRHLKNESKNRAFTAEQKETTLRIMSVIRFVLNTPEFEARMLKRQLKSSNNKSAKTTSASIKVGDPLDSKKFLRTVQRTLLETQIALAELSGGALGLATVPDYFLYFEDIYHKDYANILKANNKVTWVKFASWHNITDTLASYVSVGEVILHETTHNLGFTHHINVPIFGGKDATYTIGEEYKNTLRDPAFLEKYKHEFKKLIPYFEEKYAQFITTEPAVKSKNIDDSKINHSSLKTHNPSGEPLTIVECIIGDEATNYIKPFRYVVENGMRTTDDFIQK